MRSFLVLGTSISGFLSCGAEVGSGGGLRLAHRPLASRMPTVLLKIWPILSDSSFEHTGHRFIYGPGEGYIHVLCRAPGRLAAPGLPAARPACPPDALAYPETRPSRAGLPSTPTQVISTPESTTNHQTHIRLTSTGYEMCTELAIGSRICAGTGLIPKNRCLRLGFSLL